MQEQKSLLHRAALQFAAAGIPVFPCAPNGKDPACTHGFHDATTDVAQIDAWWAENDCYNIAFPPHIVGLGVVDLDGPEGIASWEKLKAHCADPVPDTREIETPRGGRHLYFHGELPMTAWRPGNERNLGEHIDTRGVGSYVLLPPSIVNGKSYKVLHDREIATIPDWMPVRLRRRDAERAASVEGVDDPGSIARARALLADNVVRGDIAISGRGGNNRTYQLACELSDLGLSPAVSRALLEEIWNPHCQPPWHPDELATIVSNAASYVQNERGAYAVAPAAEIFSAEVLDRLAPDEKTNAPVRSRFYAEDDEEQDNAPDPVWLIPNLIPDRSTCLLVGAKGTFKSFIAQELLLATSSGVGTFGTVPTRAGPTFYGAHEGRNAIKKPRKQSWKMARGHEGRLPFYVMRAPQVRDPVQCDEFREQIRVRLRQSHKKIAGIVLDTVAKCMVGMNENDASDCGVFIAFCDSLRDEFDCSVIAIHHYGKDQSKGGRGSSALPAGFDTVISVERHEKSLCLAVAVDYHKDADEPENPWTFEGRKLAHSLVFYPTTADEHRLNTKGEELFDGKKIGAALRELGAVGTENAVTTSVLAASLCPIHTGEDMLEHQERVNRTARALGKLSHLKLASYGERAGRDFMWSMPAD